MHYAIELKRAITNQIKANQANECRCDNMITYILYVLPILSN